VSQLDFLLSETWWGDKYLPEH